MSEAFPIHQKTAPCPVCNQKSLVGYWFELPLEQVEYNEFFLLKPMNHDLIKGKFLVENLSIFNNYFCPRDLYVYTGNIVSKNNTQEMDNNAYYTFSRYFKVRDYEPWAAARLRFFLCALYRNGVLPGEFLPADLSVEKAAPLQKVFEKLFLVANDSQKGTLDVYKNFHTVADKLPFNPFEQLIDSFYDSKPFMISFLELELADLLLTGKRTVQRGAKPFRYEELYSGFEAMVNRLQDTGGMHEDLIGNLVFQCLRMCEIMADSRKGKLLHLAYRLVDHLAAINLRLGVDLSQKLGTMSTNPDVIFYLKLLLGRMLGIENRYEATLLRLLQRRLNEVLDYQVIIDSPESPRIVKIGVYLKKYVKKLAKVINGSP